MILVYIEHSEGQIKKSSLEALTFAYKMAKSKSMSVHGFYIGDAVLSDEPGHYGATSVFQYKSNSYFDSTQIVHLIQNALLKTGANYLVLGNTSLGKTISGQIAYRINYGLISGVTDLAGDHQNRFLFKKNVFSGKASAFYSFNENKGVIAIMPKSINSEKSGTDAAPIHVLELEIPSSKIKLIERNLIKGKTPLTEAEIVVSAGRGMKDPANWGMIEELADLLHAATACSRPVADIGWRPHHEHVGQTGIAIRPNVYIAIGISGAIQHLAGVNNSRKIIVINKDPESPFFKAADYGVCGDLFEVVPKLNEAIKQYKAAK